MSNISKKVILRSLADDYGLALPLKIKNGCEKYMRGLHFGFRLLILVFGSVLFFKPTRVHTFMSIFSDPKSQPFFFPVTLFNWYVLILCCSVNKYCFGYAVVHVFSMATAVNYAK